LAANTKGICYIRVSRPVTEVVYDNDEVFEIGKAKILKKSDKDTVLLVAAGITLSQAMPAVEQLAAEGVHVRVMDPFTIKPIDSEAIISNAKECGGRILVVEDHYAEVRFGTIKNNIATEKHSKKFGDLEGLGPLLVWEEIETIPTVVKGWDPWRVL
jgi:transketolase